MTRSAKNKPMVGLAVTTALASIALAGCTTGNAPRAETSFNDAQVALAKGKVSKAIAHAESAVMAEPRNAGYRAMLGAAYLEDGRFLSAATSFGDALELGDTDPRTVLSYALAEAAVGRNIQAVAALDEWQQDIDAADLGLAYALAGQPDRGVHILSNALRGGQNSAKVRQNLAYTYALQGNWRAARVMAAEDVPADMVDDRIGEWAEMALPEHFQVRIARLLQVTPTQDSGQPTNLALANFPSQEMMVAEAAAQIPVAEDESKDFDLAFAEPQAAPAPAVVATAPTADKPAPVARTRFVSNEVVQAIPARSSASAKPAKQPTSRIASNSSQRRMASSVDNAAATHLVQLGSFSSQASAERAWTVYQSRYPQLDGRDVVITKANVDGKTYFRVAAAGFGARSAASMCQTVKAKGQGCIAYAQSQKLPGAVDKGVRIASR